MNAWRIHRDEGHGKGGGGVTVDVDAHKHSEPNGVTHKRLQQKPKHTHTHTHTYKHDQKRARSESYNHFFNSINYHKLSLDGEEAKEGADTDYEEEGEQNAPRLCPHDAGDDTDDIGADVCSDGDGGDVGNESVLYRTRGRKPNRGHRQEEEETKEFINKNRYDCVHVCVFIRACIFIQSSHHPT